MFSDYVNRTMDSDTAGSFAVGSMGKGVEHAVLLLSMALVSKLVLTIFTFGIKVPAGLFVPSLAMGAIVGRTIGIIVENLAL